MRVHPRRLYRVNRLFAIAGIVFGLLPGATHAATSREEVKRPRVLVIKSRNLPLYNAPTQGFIDGLTARGMRHGEEIELSIVSLEGSAGQDERLVREQLAAKCALIVPLGAEAARLVAHMTTDMPAVFGMVLDPVSLGVVQTLDHPGGNVTGTTSLVSPGKQFEAFLQTVPRARRIGLIRTDKDPISLALLRDARAEAKRLNARIIDIAVPPGKQPDPGMLEIFTGKVDALWITPDPAFSTAQAVARTLEYARNKQLPVLATTSDQVRDGALMALSPSPEDLGDMTAEMAVRVLEGAAKPADMRVRGPRRTLLTVNLLAARRLNIRIPRELLQLADEVIDTDTGGR